MNRRESILRGLGRLAVLFFVPLSLGVGLSPDVEAGRGKKAEKGSRADKSGKGSRPGRQEPLISRDRAAAIARSATGGQVLNIQLKIGKRPTYSVKILVNGKRVRKVGVDARTGAVR